jgi:hypothetical protein
MAEENKTGNTTFEDMMLALFAILLVGQIFQRGPELIKEKFGIDFETPKYLSANVALSATTPVGTNVVAPNGTPFYASPDENSKKIGDFPPGTSLVIEDGPKTVNGKRWWKVKDKESGEEGWVLEDKLILKDATGIGPSTKIGAKAKTIMDSDLWKTPGGLIKSGFSKMGEMGTLTKGPKEKNGSRWWFFDKDKADDDGWITESALMLASKTGWKVGSAVRAAYVADMFEKAGGNRIIGLLEKGEKAKIMGGPVQVGDTFWWLIKTKDGKEGWVSEKSLEDAGVKGWIKNIIAFFVILGTVIVLILLAGIIYLTIRTNQIRAREAERIKKAIPKAMDSKRNERLEKIMENVNSDNPNDWKLAIIEADIILDELLIKMGCVGDTLGDRLKQIARGDLNTLDFAWEAHKVRNQIAHEGGDFILTKREAKRVVDLYRAVFDELKYV